MELHKDSQKDKGLTIIPYSPDLFHNDRDFYLAYRKIEHIVSAIFLVTGLIETNDVLKNAIREHSLKCLSEIVILIGKPNTGVADLNAVAAHVLHLSSLLDIAFWSGQISQMNLAILQREISSTYQLLNDLSGKYKTNYFISSTFFKSDTDILSETKEKDKVTQHIPDVQRHVVERKVDLYKGQYKGQEIKDNIVLNNDSEKIVRHQQPREDKGHRREAILALLRERSNLTVKDFTSVVKEYSEKTIQRELLALVEEGIVRKEGERRWSTYSLSNSAI